MNVPRSAVESISAFLPSQKGPTIGSLTDPEWVAIHTVLNESDVRTIIPKLIEAGATGIVEYPISKIIK